jgi:hypothetical protein
MCHALSTGLSSKIKAEFDFAPGYGWIDAVYDVKWINVLTAYIPMPGCPPVPVVPSTPGVPLSSFPCANFLAFPAIDPNPCGTLPAGCPPAPGGCVPGGTIGADDFPYYTGEAFWTSGTPAADVEHDECALTRFCDYPTVCVAVFRLFPVLDPLSGPLAPTEFCVLDGISWFVGEPSPTGGIPAGIIGTAPADPGLIGAALAGGLAPFPAWSALPSSGCPIASPTIGVGCNSLPGPAPTISPECPPEVGAPFTWKVAGLVPSTPIPLASPVGSPPITAISAAPLAAPVDLFGLGMGIPSGACFVYLPLSLLLVGAPVGPSGVSTSTMAIPLDPTLAGISFDLQSFQLVYISTVSLTAPAAFLATPYLAVTLVP